MRFFLLSFVFCTTAYGLKCYVQVSNSTSYSPSSSDIYGCSPGVTQCYSMVADGLGTALSCDEGGEVCGKNGYNLTNGQCTYQYEIETCCCGTDLCNTAPTAAFAISSVISLLYLLFQ